MKTKRLYLFLILLAVCGLLAACGAKPEDTGEQFLQAIKSEDFDAAFDLCAPDLQAELGEAADLAFYFPTDVLQLDSWTATVTADASAATVSYMEGDVTFVDGTEGTYSLTLKQVDNQYLVDNFAFEPK
ncbi:MAG: hypothetical protein JXB38_08235 [Anaerolineales bacterium]|nr:hypothetical protein [Anaerolineales bacterium]